MYELWTTPDGRQLARHGVIDGFRRAVADALSRLAAWLEPAEQEVVGLNGYRLYAPMHLSSFADERECYRDAARRGLLDYEVFAVSSPEPTPLGTMGNLAVHT